MSRKNKAIINLILIIVILVGFLYFSGYHFSRDACIEDMLRSMDSMGRHEVMYLSTKGGKEFTLLMDDNGENAIYIETKKIGFLHKTVALGHTNSDGNGVIPIEELARGRSDKIRVMFVRRIDKSIEKVRITIGEGESVVQELTWQNDITGFSIELEKEESGVFINMEFLDANDNMIFTTFVS